MQEVSEQLTLSNFTEKTGLRFRITKAQKARIDAGEMTRDDAFAEFVANGGPSRLSDRKPEVPLSVWLAPDLTLENFKDRTGRRFRRLKDQVQRGLSAQQAFEEIVAAKRAAVTTTEEGN